jgi:hypothetical protein
MKIHGKTFGEIFELLPWAYKALVVIGISFILFVTLYTGGLIFRPATKVYPSPLFIAALEKDISSYDPALATNPVTGETWLAFSNILPLDIQRKNFGPGIRLASSAPPCKLWDLRDEGFKPFLDTITAPDNQTTIAGGIWRYETPTLIYDPDDLGHEWKLYAYKYMWTSDGNFQVARRYNMIVYRSSHTPIKGWTAEQWAFSAKADYPPPPYQDLISQKIDDLDPTLSDIIMFSRPSAVYANGMIIMSLSAFTGNRLPDRIVMIASADHGKTWQYLGTPLTAADAEKSGAYSKLDGATLLKQGDNIYLTAVFGDQGTSALGTFVFSFKDVMKGQLQRDPKTGAPLLLQHVSRSSGKPTLVGGGYAAYSDACPFGMLTGEHSGIKGVFQLFKTLRNPDGSPAKE